MFLPIAQAADWSFDGSQLRQEGQRWISINLQWRPVLPITGAQIKITSTTYSFFCKLPPNNIALHILIAFHF
jgi:hypothetical protein